MERRKQGKRNRIDVCQILSQLVPKKNARYENFGTKQLTKKSIASSPQLKTSLLAM